MMDTRQRIYAVLDRALAGPDNGDPRRNGSSTDRKEYLTDAVMAVLPDEGLMVRRLDHILQLRGIFSVGRNDLHQIVNELRKAPR